MLKYCAIPEALVSCNTTYKLLNTNISLAVFVMGLAEIATMLKSSKTVKSKIM